MTGPEHFVKAEDHLTDAATMDAVDPEAAAWHQRQAQVHATLALAAATALMPGPAEWSAWDAAAGVTP